MSHRNAQPSPSPGYDDNDDPIDDTHSDQLTEKDATELELERRVFGDDAGFYEALRLHNDGGHIGNQVLQDASGGIDQSLGEGEGDLEGVNDADLFFLDSEPSADAFASFPTPSTHDDGASSKVDNSAVWVDSDDERIMISLASNPRLRKLRANELEDVVNGKEYIKRLRWQYERLHPAPPWADPAAVEKRRKITNDTANTLNTYSEEDEEASNSADELAAQPLAKLLQNIANLTTLSKPSNSHRNHRPEIIDVHRLKDVGKEQPSAITNLTFHPRHPLLLSSGPSATLSLHHISPQSLNPNPLVTSLYLRFTPMSTSQFLPPNGQKVFFSSRRRYFHVWDLESGHIEKISRVIGHKDEQRSMERFKLSPCGRWMGLVGSSRKGGGFINVLDVNTSQWAGEVRVEGKGGIADFEWWGDGDGMVVFGKGGEAVEWDGREKRVVARWIDEGAIGTTVVALGGRGAGPKGLGGDRWLAVGSSSGIVNVYDRRKWMSNSGDIPERPKPARAFDQLTTPTSHLAFSPDGQMLCMASRWKRDALRLVHLPSCTVYRNWPTAQTPFGRITSVGWSPEGGMLAVGNEQGKCRLWEIRS